MNAIQFETPIGLVRLVADDHGLQAVQLNPVPEATPANAAPGAADQWLQLAREQLLAYFAGHGYDFDFPLAALQRLGTPFQHGVWQALRDIRHGETLSYAALARRIGQPRSVRAVAAACGRNPLPLIVPCHRVIGANGHLTGYLGGIETKRWLLRHEGAIDA